MLPAVSARNSHFPREFLILMMQTCHLKILYVWFSEAAVTFCWSYMDVKSCWRGLPCDTVVGGRMLKGSPCDSCDGHESKLAI